MKRRAFLPWLPALAAGIVLSACSGGSPSLGKVSPLLPYAHKAGGSSPIQHVVILIQENRTFNNLFATFPGAVGTTTGYERVGSGKKAKTVPITLAEVNLEDKKDLNHLYVSYMTAYRQGNMDAFNLIKFQTNNKPEGKLPYQYVNPSQIQEYWTLAQSYGLADEMFQTQGSGSFTAHQDLIRGGTAIDATDSLIDDPTSAAAWGCDSPPGTVTSLITTAGQFEAGKGPLPCTTDFPGSGSSYQTLADLLDANSISWKYYAPKFVKNTSSALWNAFDVIAHVRNGSEWGTNVSFPQTNILKDISKNQLPAVSWVIPSSTDSDHPGYSKDTGPSWVASVVNAIGKSSAWNSTAVIVLWDDWGGFYDPVAPPPLDNQGGPGFRVPMIVISPYVPAGEISNTTYEFGGILAYIENNWGLTCLGTTDCGATSIADMFNYGQHPRKYKTVKTKYPASYFLHEPPSNLPVDTQ